MDKTLFRCMNKAQGVGVKEVFGKMRYYRCAHFTPKNRKVLKAWKYVDGKSGSFGRLPSKLLLCG